MIDLVLYTCFCVGTINAVNLSVQLFQTIGKISQYHPIQLSLMLPMEGITLPLPPIIVLGFFSACWYIEHSLSSLSFGVILFPEYFKFHSSQQIWCSPFFTFFARFLCENCCAFWGFYMFSHRPCLLLATSLYQLHIW